MPNTTNHDQDLPQTAWEMARERVAAFLVSSKPRRILLLSAGRGEPLIHCNAGHHLLTVICTGNQRRHETVHARSSELPCQSQSFDLVLTEAALCEHDVAELGEISRVLRGGGHLLVVGPGHWRHWRRRRRWKTLRAKTMRTRLAQRSFEVEECLGLGFAGRAVVARRFGLLPPLVCSDLVMIRARRRNIRPIVTPLRLGRVQPAAVQSTVAEGVAHREAVS